MMLHRFDIAITVKTQYKIKQKQTNTGEQARSEQKPSNNHVKIKKNVPWSR